MTVPMMMAGSNGPALDLNFAGTGSIDPRIVFTRAAVATYFDATGTMQTAAANVPRLDFDPVTHAARGMLIEEGRTNLLLNSAALGTQAVAVTAQAYTLTFYGTGTVALTGMFTGTLVGSGAFPARSSLTFTPAASAVTATVTGTVSNAQIEAGGFATSYIATAGSVANRDADLATIAAGAWFNRVGGSFATEAALLVNNIQGFAGLFHLDDGGTNNRIEIYQVFGTNQINSLSSVAAANDIETIGTMTPGIAFKTGTTYAPAGRTNAFNGGMAAGTATPAAPAAFTVLRLGQAGPGGNFANGYVRRLRYWPRVLSNPELQQETT